MPTHAAYMTHCKLSCNTRTGQKGGRGYAWVKKWGHLHAVGGSSPSSPPPLDGSKSLVKSFLMGVVYCKITVSLIVWNLSAISLLNPCKSPDIFNPSVSNINRLVLLRSASLWCFLGVTNSEGGGGAQLAPWPTLPA